MSAQGFNQMLNAAAANQAQSANFAGLANRGQNFSQYVAGLYSALPWYEVAGKSFPDHERFAVGLKSHSMVSVVGQSDTNRIVRRCHIGKISVKPGAR